MIIAEMSTRRDFFRQAAAFAGGAQTLSALLAIARAGFGDRSAQGQFVS